MRACKENPYKECKFPMYCHSTCDLVDFTPEKCDHKDTSIVVLEIVATCEKTALQCDYCSKILTEPKTDCR